MAVVDRQMRRNRRRSRRKSEAKPRTSKFRHSPALGYSNTTDKVSHGSDTSFLKKLGVGLTATAVYAGAFGATGALGGVLLKAAGVAGASALGGAIAGGVGVPLFLAATVGFIGAGGWMEKHLSLS